MKIPSVFLLLTSLFVLSRPCLADSIGASGIYDVSGNVTIAGTLVGPCGSSPCVESLDFSFLVRATGFFDFASNSTLYGDAIVGGPGVTSASGPLGGTWKIEIAQGFDYQAYIQFESQSVNNALIDAFGFNYPDGLPRSISSSTNVSFYPGCFGASDSYSGECQYFGATIPGTETIFVTQVSQAPEPNSLLLMSIAGLGVLLAAVRTCGSRTRRIARPAIFAASTEQNSAGPT
jgi:hypothetical protein